MALIHCPECNKEISDKAESCPNCGFPIKNSHDNKTYNIPNDLSLGKKIKDSYSYNPLKISYMPNINNINDFPEGKIIITQYENGIRIEHSNKGIEPLLIHESQIISIQNATGDELVKSKSVVGRAVVGSLFGPVGAIVGGMSGMGHKKINQYYLVIKYIDSETYEEKVISFSSDSSFQQYITYYNELKEQKNHLVSTGKDIYELTQEYEDKRPKKSPKFLMALLIIIILIGCTLITISLIRSELVKASVGNESERICSNTLSDYSVKVKVFNIGKVYGHTRFDADIVVTSADFGNMSEKEIKKFALENREMLRDYTEKILGVLYIPYWSGSFIAQNGEEVIYSITWDDSSWYASE